MVRSAGQMQEPGLFSYRHGGARRGVPSSRQCHLPLCQRWSRAAWAALPRGSLRRVG